MTEAVELSHLMKGMAEDVFQLMVAKDPGSLSKLTAACKHFEKMQWYCLGKSPIRGQPNVACRSLSNAVEDLDLRSLIRNILASAMRTPSA